MSPATDSRATQQSSQATPARRKQAGEGTSGQFGLMRQMQDEIDHLFSRFGFGRSMFPSRGSRTDQMGEWAPAIDAFQHNNEFIIRADVPGMNRQDLSVEVGDEAVTIRGERRHETQEDRDGMFWSERSYGSFYRVVPLPPGAIPDSAKATFNNGVLEIVLQAPSQEARRGRKVEIMGGREEK
jgi:HSP20 family protein